MADETLHEKIEEIITSPSYQLAEEDVAFLKLPSLRPVRMQLELLKCETMMQEAGIESTIVVFGGTQIVEKAEAEQRLEKAESQLKENPNCEKSKRDVVRAKSKLAKSIYYDAARDFSKLVSGACQIDGKCGFVVVTGGGPGIMEAANRGADEIGAKSIGLNITLPHEQVPNPYITPGLCFQFHYFALRKMHFLMRARGLVVFPGGFGTLDELFCTLTLRQTHRMQEIPIVLYGTDYWNRVIDFQFLADEGVIADEHLKLIEFADSPEETWEIHRNFYGLD